MRLGPALERLDGVATLAELTARGCGARTVQRAAASGEVVRVRTGVYASLEADARIVMAARVGGRAAGAAAAEVRGLWTPPTRRLVVAVGRAQRLLDPLDSRTVLDRSRGDVAILWQRADPGRAIGVSDFGDIVREVLVSEAAPFAVAILDSMLRRSDTSVWDLEAAAARLPATRRQLLRLVDRRAESGTESVVRVLLRQAGITAVPQVRVPFTDLDRIDLLVGDRLAIECDSREHHDHPDARARDAHRDLALTALGFVVLRVRYRDAMFDGDGVVAAVRALVEAGAAVDPRVPRVARGGRMP